MNLAQSNDSSVVVLFSGGRDSTAVAIDLLSKCDELHLLSFNSGFSMSSMNLRSLRVAELQALENSRKMKFSDLDIRGLLREIALVPLVDDILHDRRQLVLLGEALAMFASAVVYAKSRGCSRIAYGATAYQSYFPEQCDQAINALSSFLSNWGIDLLVPGKGWQSSDAPKSILRRAGLTTKSLESVSMFADIDDSPAGDIVSEYIWRKLPILNNYVEECLWQCQNTREL